jgi:hypothetical protein
MKMLEECFGGSKDFNEIKEAFYSGGINGGSLNNISEATFEDEIWEELKLEKKI